MKRTLALAAALAFTVAACGDDGPTGPGGNDNEMQATVGGVPFDALAPQANYAAAQGLLTISGSQTNGGVTTVITLNVLEFNGEGTYPLSPNFVGTFGMVSTTTGVGSSFAQWSTTLSPGTGSLTVTSFDSERVAGTFQFTGQQTPGNASTGQKSVTSGTFDIEF